MFHDHNNMFANVDRLSEVYERMLADQARDTRSQEWGVRIMIGFGLLGVFCIMYFPQMQGFLVFIWTLIALHAIRLFIEKRGREFLLHIIDYHEWKEEQAKARKDLRDV